MLLTNQLVGFGASPPRAVTETITGTFSETTTGTRSIGTNGGGGHMGFQFTSTVAGTVRRVRVTTTSTASSGTFHAELWSDSAGSPGSKIGSSSDSKTVGDAATDETFTFSTEPSISNSTLYWVVIVDASNTGTPSMEKFAGSASYGSGRNNTITSIADDLVSGEDWRFEVVQVN